MLEYWSDIWVLKKPGSRDPGPEMEALTLVEKRKPLSL